MCVGIVFEVIAFAHFQLPITFYKYKTENATRAHTFFLFFSCRLHCDAKFSLRRYCAYDDG